MRALNHFQPLSTTLSSGDIKTLLLNSFTLENNAEFLDGLLKILLAQLMEDQWRELKSLSGINIGLRDIIKKSQNPNIEALKLILDNKLLDLEATQNGLNLLHIAAILRHKKVIGLLAPAYKKAVTRYLRVGLQRLVIQNYVITHWQNVL